MHLRRRTEYNPHTVKSLVPANSLALHDFMATHRTLLGGSGDVVSRLGDK